MFGTVEHSGSLDLVVVCGCHGKGNPSGSVEVLAHLGNAWTRPTGSGGFLGVSVVVTMFPMTRSRQ